MALEYIDGVGLVRHKRKSNFSERLKHNIKLNLLKTKQMKVSILNLSSARGMAFQTLPQLTGSKLGYAIQRNDIRIKKALAPFYKLQDDEQREIEEATINHAAVDPMGILLFTLTKNKNGDEQKVYQYSKEGEIEKNNKIREIQSNYSQKRDELLYDTEGNEAEVDIECYLATEYPKGFPQQFVDQFKGIYLDNTAAEKLELVKPMSIS